MVLTGRVLMTHYPVLESTRQFSVSSSIDVRLVIPKRTGILFVKSGYIDFTNTGKQHKFEAVVLHKSPSKKMWSQLMEQGKTPRFYFCQCLILVVGMVCSACEQQNTAQTQSMSKSPEPVTAAVTKPVEQQDVFDVTQFAMIASDFFFIYSA